ncbi:hypothetical protein [Aquitalea magnusonii]|uniref:hypothetical protein n=1 Tax=Aquitalea magnusonii TaxID=332411 RepID=UPI000B5C93D0|nr:hypothetical protein [Aquitalea magnusonii]
MADICNGTRLSIQAARPYGHGSDVEVMKCGFCEQVGRMRHLAIAERVIEGSTVHGCVEVICPQCACRVVSSLDEEAKAIAYMEGMIDA